MSWSPGGVQTQPADRIIPQFARSLSSHDTLEIFCTTGVLDVRDWRDFESLARAAGGTLPGRVEAASEPLAEPKQRDFATVQVLPPATWRVPSGRRRGSANGPQIRKHGQGIRSGQGDKLKLTDDELTAYDALETNKSAVAVLGDTALTQIARVLNETIRNSVTIDWTMKETVRAKLRTLVHRKLRKHGHPPDEQATAVEVVLS